MGLNDIELPASVIASLYPFALVALENEQPSSDPVVVEKILAATTAPAAGTPLPETGFKWKFLGNNQRNILVVVNHQAILHLPDEELSFLTNMLTACKLGLGDITLVNYDHYLQKGGAEILKQFKSRTVLLFGLEPAAFGLPVNFPAFQVQNVAGVSYLFSPGLTEISGDKVVKGKLWVCLKKIFGI